MTNTYHQKEQLDHPNDTWGILPMDDWGYLDTRFWPWTTPCKHDRLWPIHTKRRSMYGIYLPIYLHEFVS